MTTATLTLADFLLARIAEDEENIDGDWASGDGGLHIIGSGMRDRMVAECEAKRRIVELHDNLARETDRSGGFVLAGSYRAAVEQALVELAAVHADHPDYRDEWRP